MFGESEIGGLKIGVYYPVKVMGVINISPESFYKGSIANSKEEAINKAVEMVEIGADIIDIGGMSTAPYKETFISEEEELNRVIPVIRELSKSIDAPISIDTQRSLVAEKALSNGAEIINDVSGLKKDPRMVKVLKEYDASAIIMAYGPTDPNKDPITNVRSLLKESLNNCIKNGIKNNRLIVDPGIGFFRQMHLPWYEWDSYVLRNLFRLHTLGRPILVGVSRKSFIGEIVEEKDPGNRLFGSIASETIAVYNGASIIRTHDVLESLQAIKMAEYLRPKINKHIHNDTQAIDLTYLWKSEDIYEFMIDINVDDKGSEIMSDKGIFKLIYLTNVPKILSIVLKQEMLSLGGEVATPKDAIFSGFDKTSVLIMGTVKQLNRLVNKLKKMRFKSLGKRGLINTDDIADLIEKLLE